MYNFRNSLTDRTILVQTWARLVWQTLQKTFDQILEITFWPDSMTLSLFKSPFSVLSCACLNHFFSCLKGWSKVFLGEHRFCKTIFMKNKTQSPVLWFKQLVKTTHTKFVLIYWNLQSQSSKHPAIKLHKIYLCSKHKNSYLILQFKNAIKTPVLPFLDHKKAHLQCSRYHRYEN